MKKISFSEMKKLPDGSRVYVECVGNKWMIADELRKSWNIKKTDGLYYTDRNEISFSFDYDYVGNNMDIVCYIEESEVGCDCCQGDIPLLWKDEKNNAFVDSNGEIMVTVNGKEMRFSVHYCPCCGRKFP